KPFSINFQTATSSTLIDQLRNGSAPLLHYIYEHIYPACAKYITDNSGSETDARDFFQEAMMIIYRKVEKADFQLTSSLKTYLYAVVRNLWLRQLDKQRRHRRLSINTIENTIDIFDSTENDATECLYKQMEQAVQQLKPEARYIIANYYYQKKPLKKIAVELGYTEGYIKVKKNRVMKQLRRVLSQCQTAA
ncbi:MAG: sigma-70 family RNA polymerase sigma factor, partial [Bacteroidota bacterium]